jgi:acetyl-CoA carboxylase carboxyl transferase subunit beta
VNWINSVVRPKLQGMWKKKDVPDDLWIKCPDTGQLIFHKDLEDNLYVVPGSDYHMRMKAVDRLRMIFDGGEYEAVKTIPANEDPLKFKDQKKYADRLKDARAKTENEDSVIVAAGRLDALETVIGVQDFSFMGGSLGSAAGGAIVAGMLEAVRRKSPFILFVASGGARMQEGAMSLMQMPRATVAVQMLREAKLPYIVVLTDPTMGGVTASYAMLGDIHIAEPGALIGFAGQRVIEQTIREKLPGGFQRSEYLLEHGMVDMVVHRHELRLVLSRLCRLLMHEPVVAEIAPGLSPRREEPEMPPEVADEKNGPAEKKSAAGGKKAAPVIAKKTRAGSPDAGGSKISSASGARRRSGANASGKNKARRAGGKGNEGAKSRN